MGTRALSPEEKAKRKAMRESKYKAYRNKILADYIAEHPNATEEDLFIQYRRRCQRERRRRRLSDGTWTVRKALAAGAEPLSVQTIMSARSKPAGCSDIRWRIELNRRARVRRIGLKYADLV